MSDIGHHASSGQRLRLDRGQIAVVVVLLAAPLIAFPARFIPRALLDGGDDLLANLPQLVYSSQRLLEGEILWVPELWMGHPLLGEPEFATFYLPKLLLLVGPPVVTYAAYLVLHYLFAEIGAYLYLKHIGIGRLGAVFGALAYAYAGFMLGHRAHTMYVCAGAWAPFVLLSFERVVSRGTGRDYLLAALAFAMLPLCGAVQLTVYLAGTLLFIAGARSLFERRLRPLAATIAGLIPALLLSALQLVPSYAFARQLATNMRADYELGVMHSFHPMLLPTLALPLPPLDAELYSRSGVVVLCAAAVALARIRSAPILIRAWALLAAVALLLMLGRYFAPLAHLLHGLPVIGVLRGPARHNFELGLALSVLGAYGVDIAQRAGAASVLRWLGAAAGFSLFSYAAVRLARAGHVADPASVNLLTNVTASTAVGAALAFLVWIVARAQPATRGSRLRWGLVAVAPLLETVWAMRLEARPNASALGLIEQARSVLSETRGDVRLLSVSLHRGSVDALAGNSVLFHPKVESLQGYSSIAYSTARQVLELDMHGQPSFYHELAFSILPSVFGVTHVVLPSAICDKAEFAIAAGLELCVRSDRDSSVTPASQSVSGEVGCTALLTDATHSYYLESTGHALDGNDYTATLSFFGGPDWEARFALDLPGSALQSGADRWSEPWRLSEAEDWGFLVARNLGSRAVALSDTGLFVEREVSLTALAPFAAAELVPVHTRVSADFLRLESPLSPVHVQRQGPVHVERRAAWPRTARTKDARVILEVEARAAATPASDLVIDVHSEPDYDPDRAELVIPGSQLGPSWRTFRTEIDLSDAPEQFSLRALARAGSPVDLREARLATTLRESVYRLPLASNRYESGARVDGDRITLDADSRISGGAHLPLRAFEVLLDAEAPDRLDGGVTFGLDTPTRYTPPRKWRIDRDAFNGRTRIHHVAIVPASARDPRLFVHVEGTKPLNVHELSAGDACSRRGYRNPKRLANGLFLYENPHALPRAYTVGQTVQADDPVSVRRALLDFGVADLGKKVVVGENLPADLRPGAIERADFGQRYNEIVVRAEAGPTLLVINERFDPGWRATIDGEEAAIVPVNGIVRGVVVSPGTHRVRLEYRVPGAVWVGVVLALIGLLSAAFAMPLLDRLGWFGKKVDQSP